MSIDDQIELEILKVVEAKNEVIEIELFPMWEPLWPALQIMRALPKINNQYLWQDNPMFPTNNPKVVRKTAHTHERIAYLAGIAKLEEQERQSKAAAEESSAKIKALEAEADKRAKQLSTLQTEKAIKNYGFTQWVSVLTLFIAALLAIKTLACNKNASSINELKPYIDTVNSNLRATAQELKAIGDKLKKDTIRKNEIKYVYKPRPKAKAGKYPVINILTDKVVFDSLNRR